MLSDGEIVDEEEIGGSGGKSQQQFDRDSRSNSTPTTTTISSSCCHSLLITELPTEKSLTSCHQSLYLKFKKYGKISSLFINLVPNANPQAIINYQSNDSAHLALQSSQVKTVFGRPIKYKLVHDIPKDVEAFHLLRIDKKISRFLYLSIMERQVQKRDLYNFFKNHGRIIECEVRQKQTTTCLLQFDSFKSAHSAHQYAMIKNFGSKPMKARFEQSQPCNVLILSSIGLTVASDMDLASFLKLPLMPNNVIFNRVTGAALLFFDSRSHAQEALGDLRDKLINLKFFEADYANNSCQVDFLARLEGQILAKYKSFLLPLGFRININKASGNVYGNSTPHHDVVYSNRRVVQQNCRSSGKSSHSEEHTSKRDHKLHSMLSTVPRSDTSLHSAGTAKKYKGDSTQMMPHEGPILLDNRSSSSAANTCHKEADSKADDASDQSSQYSFPNSPCAESNKSISENSPLTPRDPDMISDDLNSIYSAGTPKSAEFEPLDRRDNKESRAGNNILTIDKSEPNSLNLSREKDLDIDLNNNDSAKTKTLLACKTFKYPLSVLYEEDELDRKFKEICNHIKKTQQYYDILNSGDRSAAVEKLMTDSKFMVLK
ncbi:MAG: hypothetical protein MHMPM18_001505 [Marteilia pararefringens]